MKRRTIIARLNGLAELYDQVRALSTGNTGEWVGLGLLSQEELDQYLKGWDAESKIDQAGRIAEDAVPRPAYNDDPRIPKEYREIIDRMNELAPFVLADKKARDVLGSLKSRGYYGGKTIGERLGLASMADQVYTALQNAEDDYGNEYRVLEAKKERKERQGSVVLRLRLELYDAFEAARKTARNEAQIYEAVKYQGIIIRKKELERLIEKRRAQKLRVLSDQMRPILATAGKGAK